MTRVFAVVNTAAGAGRTARIWPRVRDALASSGAMVEAVHTSARRHAARLATEAAKAGWPIVLAVGGDGTLNEVVDGVIGAGAPAAVAAVMTGRGRDACRNFGVARDPCEAARRVVAGTPWLIDVGVADWPDGTRRCFIGTAGSGFDAEVARRSASTPGAGTWPYVRTVLASLAAHRPVSVSITVDDRVEWRGRVTAVVAANGRHFGGGMRIAPGAAPDDGRLQLVVLGDLGRLELLRWLPTVYWGGHIRSSHVAIAPAHRIEVTAADPLPVHVDGEPAPATPVTFSLLPRALRFIR